MARRKGDNSSAATSLSPDRLRLTALAILDAEGPDGLSMRRLAQVLDRKPMTLYRYAPNKAALLDGVVELVLRDLRIDPAADDWPEELRKLAAAFQRLATAHPHVVPLLVTLPQATPLGLRPVSTLRLLEDFLTLLTRAGFGADDALQSYRLLFAFLHGHALATLQETVQDPEDAEDRLQSALLRLPRSDFPQLRKLAAELAGYDGASQLRQGVEMLISGLRSRFQATVAPEHSEASS